MTLYDTGEVGVIYEQPFNVAYSSKSRSGVGSQARPMWKISLKICCGEKKKKS